MAVAGEVTRHGWAHPYSWSITIVSLRSKESEEWTTSVSETELLRHIPCCYVSSRIRHVPVPLRPGTKSTWGLAEVRWTFSQHSTVSDTQIPRERSDLNSKSTPNPADTPSAWAYSFNINIFGNNVRMFEKQYKLDCPKKKDATPSRVVYFSFAITCNIDQQTLIALVGMIEWSRGEELDWWWRCYAALIRWLPLYSIICCSMIATQQPFWKFQKILIYMQLFCMDNTSNDAVLDMLSSMAFLQNGAQGPRPGHLFFQVPLTQSAISLLCLAFGSKGIGLSNDQRIPATATSSQRAFRELPESSQRAPRELLESF